MTMYGGIEGGGTKFRCVVGTGPEDIRAERRVDTADPEGTIRAVLEFFLEARAEHPSIDALGIASFGPLEGEHGSGYRGIGNTPKRAWRGVDLVGPFAEALRVPVMLDTDVNAAARGEHRWGAGRGLRVVAYVTVGTGIGGGVVVDGEPLPGVLHPEIGHMRIPVRAGDEFPGACPFHGHCWEGLASGPALRARWGTPPDALGQSLGEARALEAFYVGTALANLALVVSPDRIVLGGGVLAMPGLMAAVRSAFADALAGYGTADSVLEDIDGYISAPELGSRSGVIGALVLAETALREHLRGHDDRAASIE